MAIDPAQLHRPPDKWPLLLAGPIVRRVTRRSVAVFIAARDPVRTVTLTVYDGVGVGRRQLSVGTRASVALGEFLHVCVVEATGLVLAPGRLYGYDVRLETAHESKDLAGLGLLSEPVPLGYVTDLLPGFVLPGPLDKLRVVHASCRKSHGCEHESGVDPDALPLVDRLIQERREDPWSRPQQLLLTGDQIYSDDVPAALLAALTSAGSTLLGWGAFPEELPDRAGQPVVSPPDDPDGPLAPGNRSTFLHDQGVKDKPPDADPAAWTDYAANHLLFFSEWCAMYLFAWSPELWQTAEALSPGIHLQFPNVAHCHLPPADEVWAASPDTTTPALVYAQNLVFVRRAMANVATYMVFDDHDVTDDWFLNGKVSDQLRGGPTGRRLMRNGLAAYAVFQHWGNVPEAFADGTHGGALLELLDASSGTPAIGSPGQETAADELLDVGVQPLGPDRAGDRMRWDYELVFDEHRLIALDTRTWRHYPLGPRAPSEQELRDAAAARPAVIVDWGPEALDSVAATWHDAGSATPRLVEDFLRSGAGLLTACAALGRTGAAQTGPYEEEARLALDAAVTLVDTVGGAPGTVDQGWALAPLEDASEAIDAPRNAPGVNLEESVLRVATAMHEAVFVLREGQDEWMAGVAIDSLDEEALAFATAFGTLAEALEHAGAFLQGAVHSRPRAARNAERLVGAWSRLAHDCAPVLWGEDAEAADDALWTAAMAMAPVQADLANAASAFEFDPVRDLLNDADRRRGAELISAEALVFQVHERVWDTDSRRPLTLVVSPPPVFGHALVEAAQRGSIMKGQAQEWLKAQGAEPLEDWDAEPWTANLWALNRFLDALAPLGSVVLLSGDVHYGFSSVTDYLAARGASARFLQLTSSSAKNADSKTKNLALFDEARGLAVRETTMTPLDFVSTLPTQEEWDAYGPDVQALILSREQALEALGEQRDAAGEPEPDPAGTWWTGGFDMISLRDALGDTGTTAWNELTEDTAAQTASELDAVSERWEDPQNAYIGDRVHASPLAEGGALAVGEAVGADPRLLPEQTTTTLRDRRGAERSADSPGLEARLDAHPFMRPALVRGDRSTVGHCNIGVITTHATVRGRFVGHELHWFPFDTLDAQAHPDVPGAAFRDDWIVTRHCAGLQRGMPADGSLAGACDPAPEATPIGLRIDVTSPGQSESGPSRVHAIGEAAPSMPDILVEVRMFGVSAAAEEAQAREVRLTCSYLEGNRHDVVLLPGPTEDDWLPLEPGRTSWRPSFPDFCGGELRVHARAEFGGVPLTGDTGAFTHVIFGRNPTKADLRAQADLRPHTASRTSIEVVFHRESFFTQFAASPSALGPFVPGPAPVLRSPDNSFGAGQLDDPRPTVRECWHWRENVDGAVDRLNGFRADALAYQRQVQQGLPWNAATGTLDPAPPGEGVAHPDAPAFTTDQLDLEMWARYNSGRRYHDWDGRSWVQQPSDSTGVTNYAPELLVMRRRVDAGDFPAEW